MIVDADISAAPTAGLSVMPASSRPTYPLGVCGRMWS
jgi:hypothetical protein